MTEILLKVVLNTMTITPPPWNRNKIWYAHPIPYPYHWLFFSRYSAKIIDIDEEDTAVLVHFEGWNSRYDQWMDMSSEKIRAKARHSGRKEKRKSANGVNIFFSNCYSTERDIPWSITVIVVMSRRVMGIKNFNSCQWSGGNKTPGVNLVIKCVVLQVN